MSEQTCPICGIASGREQANLVYDDARVVKFFLLQLSACGHELVAPEEHHQTVWDLEKGLFTVITTVTQALAERFARGSVQIVARP